MTASAAPIASATAASPIPARLSALRAHMAQQGWQAVLLPSSDPHLSEYLPERWQGRVHFSGFTGSSGTLLVAAERAAVFTDSRYWTQAEAELAGSGVDLVKLDGAPVPAYTQWLQALGLDGLQGATLALDGSVMGLAQTQQLADALAALSAPAWRLHATDDVLDGVWPERPGLPSAPVFEHLPPHASTSRRDKLAALREALRAKGASHHWVATLDDLAWLLNLRGADVDYNPVFLGHALVSLDAVQLFVGEGKVDAALQARLADDGVAVRPYADALSTLKTLPPGSVLRSEERRVGKECRL